MSDYPSHKNLSSLAWSAQSVPSSCSFDVLRGGMTESMNQAASGNLPWFVTALGETDTLVVVMGVILILFVLMVGILYFHALPDRFAHKKVQFEIVCVLGLIAMFTNMHIFWIAGLLLALVEFPDFSTPLKRIAGATEKMAGVERSEGKDQTSYQRNY